MNESSKGLQQVNQQTGEITIAEPPLSADNIIERRNVIKQIMSKAMVDGMHYGQVPGTQGKALLKMGADMLMSVFHIAAEPEVFDLSGGVGANFEIRYRVLLRGKTIGSGQLVGVGVGECSSNEEKYRWKKANNNVFENTPENMKRVKYVGNGSFQQVRQNPFDIANTILKMAKKRASVDFVLTALGAAEMFEEFEAPDMPANGTRPPPTDHGGPPPDYDAPPPETATTAPQDDKPAEGKASGAEIHKLRKAADAAGLREVDVLAQFEAVAWNELTPAQVAEGLEWIEGMDL